MGDELDFLVLSHWIFLLHLARNEYRFLKFPGSLQADVDDAKSVFEGESSPHTLANADNIFPG